MRARWYMAYVLLALLPAGVDAASPNDPYFSSTGAWGQPFADQIGLASNPRTVALQLTLKY